MTYLSRPSVTLLGESDVTDALVVWVHLEVTAVGDVVEVLDVLIINTRMPRFSSEPVRIAFNILSTILDERSSTVRTPSYVH